MENVKLSIVPCPKPRMTQSDRWKKRACTTRYWEFKDELLRLWDNRQVPQQVHAVFTLPMPKSWSAKKKAIMCGKPHQMKPDADNLLKAFLDCLLADDAAIWDTRATKYWGHEGSIEVIDMSVPDSTNERI